MAIRQTDSYVTAGKAAAGTLRRRGLIAGAAVLAAGLLARETKDAAPVAAANGDPLLLGSVNGSLNGTTVFLSSGAGQLNGGNSFQVIALNYNGQLNNGLYGAGVNGGYGTVGYSDSGSGVFGSYGSGSPAPYLRGGVAAAAPNGGQAVSGTCNGAAGYGVFGYSDIGYAVYGSSTSGRGVYGYSSSNNGVQGVSGNGGIGVYGQGPQYGVVGNATAAGGYGVYGLATVNGTAGFAGGTNNASAFAAVFGGRVVINDGPPGVPGGLIVNGSLGITGTKSAIVPDGSGGHRLMYCVEAPESWFEDFGEGTLSGGKAEVKLAADFASTVDTNTLHVFLTPHDAAHHLAVTARSGTGFSVGAGVSGEAAASGVKAASVSGTFTYRVVAKRKDVVAPRLAPVELPQVKLNFPKLAPPVPEKKPDGTGPLPASVSAPSGVAKP